MKNALLKKVETLGKKQFIEMLNQALKSELAARDQFLAHAELVKKVSTQRILRLMALNLRSV